MRKITAIFLQAIVVLIGIAAFVFLLWEPHLEGVNANATTLSEIYFDDPFLACVYLVSIAFFVGLYKTFTLLGNFGQNKLYSLRSVKALQTIKYCAMFLIGSLLVAEAYLFMVQRHVEDDIAGGVAMGVFLILIFTVIGTTATVLERTIKRAVDIKS